MLDLQSSIAKELARCDEALSQVTLAQQKAVTGILTRESPPIWSADLRLRARTSLPDRLREIAGGYRTEIQQYASDPSRGMPLHVTLFLALVLVCCAARRKRRGWAATGEGVSATVTVFEHPYAAALIVSLFIASAVISPAPARVKELFSILALVSMIRLVRPVVDARLAPGLYAVAALYALDVVRQNLGGAPLIEQVLLSPGKPFGDGGVLVAAALRNPPASTGAGGSRGSNARAPGSRQIRHDLSCGRAGGRGHGLHAAGAPDYARHSVRGRPGAGALCLCCGC